MSGLLVSLISNYELGMMVNAREGLNLLWNGERIYVIREVENQSVWVEQNASQDRFLIGFGSPGRGAWLTHWQANQLLLDYFGGLQ
jgi:hypothetical protein